MFFILQGLIGPSKGTVIVNGHDMQKETKQARESMGLCPQHDVLFPELTVKEHLEFYARVSIVVI